MGNNVAVLVGNGDGTFDPAVTYPSGGGAFGLAAGHLDADGHLDLVTADYLGDGISVLLGNGDGSFDPPVAYPVGSSPFSVATADVNGDGELDVIAANQGSQINSYVVVFLGNGDGTLASGVEFPTPAGPTVIAGDLDADGRPDIATANGQADSVSVLLNQAQAATTTNLVASAASSTYGQEASFTATVSGHDIEGHAPGGTVTFFDGTTVVGTAGVSSGTATLTTSALAGGTHQITARYDGDPNFASSTSTAVVHAVDLAATTTAVTSSPNPSTAGDAVTFTATVSGTAAAEADATGAVTFLDGGTSLGSAPLGSGVASLSLSSLAPGDHAITAVYGGDANFSASTSAPSTHVVVSRVPASREDCLNGGWRTMTDDEGNPFSSQGACVSFVSRGSNAGRNR